MNVIKLQVKKNHMEVLQRNIITSGNIGYIECDFYFDEDWDGKQKHIVLICGSNPPVTDKIQNDKYIIPASVLARVPEISGTPNLELKIGVYGVGGIDEIGELQRITSDFVKLSVIRGSYIEGQTPPGPEDDIYLKIIAEKVTDIEFSDGKLQLMASGVPIGEPVDIMEYILKALETENVSKSPYIGEDGCWYTYDNESGAYVNTGISASGDTESIEIDFIESLFRGDIDGGQTS